MNKNDKDRGLRRGQKKRNNRRLETRQVSGDRLEGDHYVGVKEGEKVHTLGTREIPTRNLRSNKDRGHECKDHKSLREDRVRVEKYLSQSTVTTNLGTTMSYDYLRVFSHFSRHVGVLSFKGRSRSPRPFTIILWINIGRKDGVRGLVVNSTRRLRGERSHKQVLDGLARPRTRRYTWKRSVSRIDPWSKVILLC